MNKLLKITLAGLLVSAMAGLSRADAPTITSASIINGGVSVSFQGMGFTPTMEMEVFDSGGNLLGGGALFVGWNSNYTGGVVNLASNPSGGPQGCTPGQSCTLNLQLKDLSLGYAVGNEFAVSFMLPMTADQCTSFVTGLYYSLLQSAPDASLGYWVNQCTSGMTLAAITNGFMASPAYQQKLAAAAAQASSVSSNTPDPLENGAYSTTLLYNAPPPASNGAASSGDYTLQRVVGVCRNEITPDGTTQTTCGPRPMESCLQECNRLATANPKSSTAAYAACVVTCNQNNPQS